jgi:DNA-binding NarL/FixJ family response regulator
VRVAVADDSALIRDGLAHVLPRHGHQVVAAVGDAPALLAAVTATRPDVALVDIRMPPSFSDEGIVAAARIRAEHPGVGVVVLSQHVDADYALGLIADHPSRCGYLLKDRVTDMRILAEAIGRVGAGGTVVDPELVALLLARPAARDRLAELTPREREVLGLVAEGLTDRGIGERLWLTTKTVETHVRHILAKLGLPPDATYNRRVLAVLAHLRRDAP